MVEIQQVLSLLGVKQGETVQAVDFRANVKALNPTTAKRLKLDERFPLDVITIAFKRTHPDITASEVSRHVFNIVKEDLTIPAIGEADVRDALAELKKRNNKWW